MATIKQHCHDCVMELGEGFENVHEWLDELQPVYGPMHRPFRHHSDAVEQIRRRWGDRAAMAAQIHIRKDCGGVIPSQADYREKWNIKLEDIEPQEFNDE